MSGRAGDADSIVAACGTMSGGEAGRMGLRRLVEAVGAMANVSSRVASLDGGTGNRLAELTSALQPETGSAKTHSAGSIGCCAADGGYDAGRP